MASSSKCGSPRSTRDGRSGPRWQRADAEVGQLRVGHRRRRPGHRIGARLRLREGNDLADVLLAGEDRREAVDAEREAAVRRGAVAERSEEEPEATVGFLLVDTEQVEDPLLQRGL